MKILVTGGAGYIGSHTVVNLQKASYQVVVVDDLRNSSSLILSRIAAITGTAPEFYQLNLASIEVLPQLVEIVQACDATIHFAALKAVGESVEQPWNYYNNNLNSLLTLLKAYEEADHYPPIIFSSSCTVYGNPDQLPVTEDTPQKQPYSPYGASKQMCERILQDLAVLGKLNCTLLRYFNPVGAHQSGEIGELPIGRPNNLMPLITQSAAGLRGPITVYGNDYNTVDGTCVRDYIHVTDLAEAHYKALEQQLKSPTPVAIYNLGSGSGFSVLEVIEAFNRYNDRKVSYSIGARRPGDVDAIYADSSKAEQELDWRRKLSLEDMVISAWEWQKKIEQLQHIP